MTDEMLEVDRVARRMVLQYGSVETAKQVALKHAADAPVHSDSAKHWIAIAHWILHLAKTHQV